MYFLALWIWLFWVPCISGIRQYLSAPNVYWNLAFFTLHFFLNPLQNEHGSFQGRLLAGHELCIIWLLWFSCHHSPWFLGTTALLRFLSCPWQAGISSWFCSFWSLISRCTPSPRSSARLFVSSLPQGFPDGPDGKKSARNDGDPGLIPGLGRSPGERNGNSLQYSCLENLMDRGAW